ncbi:class I SAM-dependent methyltransferase [Denitrobaculum tricleocarpae]|uniref:Methyltransferase domain-containing protein n=1 Tax=Denitrobaculum tricleocarpae TaxID=2591009 RepID=A0A545TTH7_9PROT|nr:class I SAM-dependent methyltransferase [Denitrobaculum tricleocarpae]TQV80524.1 methyltransferase domain-containing protein [Denitrobaculum tricleocarpae]
MLAAGKYWDKVARRYETRPIKNLTAYHETLDRTRARLSPNDRVLELGCGTGMTALKLADAVAQMTASDISAEMVAIGREKASAQGVENVEFLQATAFDDALGRGGYDAVLAFNYLHLMEDTEATVARIESLLKPGGVFISKTVCLANANFFFRLLMRLMIPVMQWLNKAPYVRAMSSAEVESCIGDAGFEILESRSFTDQSISRFVVARKTRAL